MKFLHVCDARQISLSSEHRAFSQPVAKITISLVVCIFQQENRFEAILFDIDVIGCWGWVLNDLARTENISNLGQLDYPDVCLETFKVVVVGLAAALLHFEDDS